MRKKEKPKAKRKRSRGKGIQGAGPGARARARENAKAENEWLRAQKEAQARDPNTNAMVRLPPLVEMVLENWAFETRGAMVRQYTKLYKCSAGTIDRAREQARQTALAWARGRKDERISKSVSFLEGVSRRAMKMQRPHAAVQAEMAARKLTGDVAPDKVLLMPSMPEADSLARVKALMAKAEEAKRAAKRESSG